MNAVCVADVLRDLRRGRQVYLQLPFPQTVQVCFGTIVRLHAVSTDEELFLCQAEDRLIWISCLLLVLWHVQDRWAGLVPVAFQADPTWPQSHRYLSLEVGAYVQVLGIYSLEHGWNGWARGVLWGVRTQREGIFPLSILVPQLMVVDGPPSWPANDDVTFPAEWLASFSSQTSSDRPLSLPLPCAGTGRHISVDPIWRCHATGALLFVGDDACASDLRWLRGAEVGCIVNCTGNLDLHHYGQPDLQYYRFDVSRFSIWNHTGMFSENDVVHHIQPMLFFASRRTCCCIANKVGIAPARLRLCACFAFGVVACLGP